MTDDELAKIAAWEPIAPGFDREDATVEAYIRPILDQLASDRRLRVRVVEDGGMSNYFAFLVNEAGPEERDRLRVSGVAVQLSLMAPVGVFGPTTFSAGNGFFAWSGLKPEQVCDPDSPSGWLAEATVAAVRGASPYRLVGRDVTDQPLPPGIEIYEYCLSPEPWNRVFHALFANTD